MGKFSLATSKDGTRIAYDMVGHGPVIMLVLGALNSRRSGAKLAKLLASRFTVINYDRRGRGDSTDTLPFEPKREIEDIAAIINEIGEPVYLYGHSSGAAIALEAAIELGGRVKKLAIYEAPYATDGEARKAAIDYDVQLKKLIAEGHNGDAVALFMRLVGVSDNQIQAMKRTPMWRGLETMAPTLRYDSEVLGKDHSVPIARLAGITRPTLVMDGGASPASMRGVSESIGKAIPNAQRHTLDGQTHGVKPEVLAPLLIEFFSERTE
jgi:pimeloyl-ACP methyl ester carboxylesterase